MTCKFYSIISAAMLLLMQISCSTTVADGSGSEVTNGVVIAANGLPAKNIKIAAYLPNSNYADILDTTDIYGRYSLEIDSGLYNIFVIDSTNNQGVCIPLMELSDIDDTIRLDTLGAITVEPCSLLGDSICGIVRNVFIPGSPFIENFFPDSIKVLFDFIPQGEYSMEFQAELIAGSPNDSIDRSSPILATIPVTITSGDTINLQ